MNGHGENQAIVTATARVVGVGDPPTATGKKQKQKQNKTIKILFLRKDSAYPHK